MKVPTARSIGLLTRTTISNTQSRLFKSDASKRTRSWRSALSTKSTYSPTLRKINTSSSTSICLRLRTTFILSTNSVMEALSSHFFERKELFLKNGHFLYLNKLSMLFKCSTNITLCTEILSLITSSSVQES